CNATFGLYEFVTRPTTFMVGTSWTKRPRSLALRSEVIPLTPVMLPPGRARLATNPDPTGSPTDVMTIGIVEVARRTAITVGVAHATMTSTFALTRSVIALGS